MHVFMLKLWNEFKNWLSTLSPYEKLGRDKKLKSVDSYLVNIQLFSDILLAGLLCNQKKYVTEWFHITYYYSSTGVWSAAFLIIVLPTMTQISCFNINSKENFTVYSLSIVQCWEE